MPHEIIRSGMAYFFPKIEQRITRTLTMPRTATFASGRSGTGSIGPGKPVPYISFDAVVGRNSQFKDLSSEQLEELGGVEYRALKVLMWIVPSVSLSARLLLSLLRLTRLPLSISTSSSSNSPDGSSSGPTLERRVATTMFSRASLESFPSDGELDFSRAASDAIDLRLSLSLLRFAIFQSVSAFSNTGMSLVDTSMIPFQEAYLMVLVSCVEPP